MEWGEAFCFFEDEDFGQEVIWFVFIHALWIVSA